MAPNLRRRIGRESQLVNCPFTSVSYDCPEWNCPQSDVSSLGALVFSNLTFTLISLVRELWQAALDILLSRDWVSCVLFYVVTRFHDFLTLFMCNSILGIWRSHGKRLLRGQLDPRFIRLSSTQPRVTSDLGRPRHDFRSRFPT